MLSMTSNFDNEVEILRSRTLIKKVVSDMGLYIDMEESNALGFNPPLYKNSPVNVFITPEEADRLVAPVELRMRYTKEGQLTVRAEYKIDKEGDEETMEQGFDRLPAILPTPVGVFSFTGMDSIPELEGGEIELVAHVHTPTSTAEAYGKELSVTPSSKTTTIAKVSLRNTVRRRGVDFINRLVSFYNQDANDEKNEVAQKTAEFIEERIGIINGELGTTESELAAFKQRSGLTNLTSDAQMALQESSRYEQQRTENATQINLVQYLRNYIDDPANMDEVIPANVGLRDQNINSVIDDHRAQAPVAHLFGQQPGHHQHERRHRGYAPQREDDGEQCLEGSPDRQGGHRPSGEQVREPHQRRPEAGEGVHDDLPPAGDQGHVVRHAVAEA